MEILLPLPPLCAKWQQQVECAANESPLLPFEPLLLDFVHEVSTQLMSSKKIRSYPELVSLAYWMRKSHIHQIMQEYRQHYRHSIPMPRGVVLHIAPTNVDSIFMYSWFLALLTGNVNIIRLSSRSQPQQHLLLELLNNIFHNEIFEPIRKRNIILSYGHENEITKTLSAHCQVRVIWGGDQTVNDIRSIPLPPDAVEVSFADKFSWCALQAEKVLAAPAPEFENLLEQFFNDAFWFNQNACSSPRLVLWVGENSTVCAAKQRFWNDFKTVLEQKKLYHDPASRINRMVCGYNLAAQGLIDSMSSANADHPYRVQIKNITADLRQQHTGNGVFLETEIMNLAEMIPYVSPKDQTLSIYGFNQQEIYDFASQLHGRGFNRIVPIGQALTFHYIWDGINLLTAFTRELTIPSLSNDD